MVQRMGVRRVERVRRCGNIILEVVAGLESVEDKMWYGKRGIDIDIEVERKV